MVIPASYNILSDKLPRGLGNLDQLAEIDTLYQRMQRSGYVTVDMASALSQHAPVSYTHLDVYKRQQQSKQNIIETN